MSATAGKFPLAAREMEEAAGRATLSHEVRYDRKLEIKSNTMKAVGIWLLALLLAVTCALPAAIAPSATTKGDAARVAFNVPLHGGRRASRALPIDENLRSFSTREEPAPRGSFGRISEARSRQMSSLSARVFPYATVTSFPLKLLCRLRI